MRKRHYSQFIEHLYAHAKSAKWKMLYDRESDSLFWTKKPIPAGDRLAKASKEIFFYLGANGEIDGLMIRPFQSNFVSHNQEVRKVGALFTQKVDDEVLSIPTNKRKEAEPLIATLSATIGKNIYRDAIEAKHPLDDLERFFSSTSSRVR